MSAVLREFHQRFFGRRKSRSAAQMCRCDFRAYSACLICRKRTVLLAVREEAGKLPQRAASA